MMLEIFDDSYDLGRIIVKPLYFGLSVNIMLPVGVLLVCYYLNNNHYIENRIGNFANTLFYVFGMLALAESGFALWWRYILFRKPMIRRLESFEHDFTEGLLSRSRLVFLIIAFISVYGYLYFFLTGRFQEAVFFVVLSFVVFQVARPRYGYVRKLIKYQKSLVDRGELLSS